MLARVSLSALCALAMAACGQAGQEEEALELLAPPEGAVIGARLNPVESEQLDGLTLNAHSVQRISIEDPNIRADSALRWRVHEVIPGDTYTFELTANRQQLPFGSMMRIELGYPGGSEFVECQFRINDGEIRLAAGPARARERQGALVFPCEAATRDGLDFMFLSVFPAVTYSNFIRSEQVTGALEFQSVSYRRRQRDDESGG